MAKVETTAACAGATTPAALAEVKRMGYASVINRRQAGEPGADIHAAAAAAKAARHQVGRRARVDGSRGARPHESGAQGHCHRTSAKALNHARLKRTSWS